MEARLIHRVVPVYPPEARAANISGTVKLHVIVSTEGTVGQLDILSGPPELIKAALEAVRQWRYKPFLLNDEPVEVDTYIDIIFSLGG